LTRSAVFEIVPRSHSAKSFLYFSIVIPLVAPLGAHQAGQQALGVGYKGSAATAGEPAF
jgi:hypothetical protein